ncbi:unnamed protein product [Enterobius vermicularis]|uniref:Methyltransf_11 domain-containing protein n=1 Tax=Enterobius vermicularis TaxID=51028 RepID=A0A0N4VP46_ENTVE|nr:unnamed protein product [Enterobius vermicularis]
MVLNLAEAEESFLKLLEQVEPRKVAEFLSWINDSFAVIDGRQHRKSCGTSNASTFLTNSFPTDAAVVESDAFLRKIAVEMRAQVPQDAIFESETTFWPEDGLDSDCDPATTVHVDSFLYDDDDVDDLVDANLLSRNFCTKCGSKEVKPLTFITHSLSIDQLRYIFTVLVPLNQAMHNRLILDIGSRLGAVLYGVFYYSGGYVNAVGIEMNKDLCALQKKIVVENGMQDRIKVINDDVRNQREVVAAADVIVMNNVFSFFLPLKEQISCFEFLYASLRPGTVIISNPTLEAVTEHLSLPFKISSWVDKGSFFLLL